MNGRESRAPESMGPDPQSLHYGAGSSLSWETHITPGVGIAAGMPVWRDAHTGCSKQDMQRETLRRFPVHYKLCQPLSGRAFSKRLSEDFINTAAAGTAQGLNLKHVLLWLRVLMHLVNIWIQPAPSRPFFSPRAVGLSGGEGSLKADSVLQGRFHSSASPRDNLAVRSVA